MVEGASGITCRLQLAEQTIPIGFANMMQTGCPRVTFDPAKPGALLQGLPVVGMEEATCDED